MTYTSSFYYVESQDSKGQTRTVGHSKDKKTKEIYYKFLDRAKANKLLKDEKEAAPKLKCRVVKVTTTVTRDKWQ